MIYLKQRVIFEKFQVFKKKVCSKWKSVRTKYKMEESIFTLMNHWNVERFVLFHSVDWHFILWKLQKPESVKWSTIKERIDRLSIISKWVPEINEKTFRIDCGYGFNVDWVAFLSLSLWEISLVGVMKPIPCDSHFCILLFLWPLQF